MQHHFRRQSQKPNHGTLQHIHHPKRCRCQLASFPKADHQRVRNVIAAFSGIQCQKPGVGELISFCNPVYDTPTSGTIANFLNSLVLSVRLSLPIVPYNQPFYAPTSAGSLPKTVSLTLETTHLAHPRYYVATLRFILSLHRQLLAFQLPVKHLSICLPST